MKGLKTNENTQSIKVQICRENKNCKKSLSNALRKNYHSNVCVLWLCKQNIFPFQLWLQFCPPVYLDWDSAENTLDCLMPKPRSLAVWPWLLQAFVNSQTAALCFSTFFHPRFLFFPLIEVFNLNLLHRNIGNKHRTSGNPVKFFTVELLFYFNFQNPANSNVTEELEAGRKDSSCALAFLHWQHQLWSPDCCLLCIYYVGYLLSHLHSCNRAAAIKVT